MPASSLTKDAVQLTRKLLEFNTINPPGQEARCAEFLGSTLAAAGFQTAYHDLEPGRPSLLAWIDSPDGKPPICFTGHIDTVPLGAAAWARDPFAGETDGDKLFGRGATDMKSGVAAMVVAAVRAARTPGRKAGILLILTAGEEVACAGAFHLASLPGVLPAGGALVVGEPTCNEVMIGHKGVLWLRAKTSGKTAHASMPEEGDNAIFKAAKSICAIEELSFDARHDLLGRPTVNIGTVAGGDNINSVPDGAEFTIDIRPVPGQETDAILDTVKHLVGEAKLEILQDVPAVASNPSDAWIQSVFDRAEAHFGRRPQPAAAPYCTDASALVPALGGPPMVVAGPGELDQAHKTDEFCLMTRIEACTEFYLDLIERWAP